MPDFSRVSLIDASPHNPGTAYVAAKNYQNDDRKPYIYQDRRLRQDLDQDRHRHSRQRFRARRARRHPNAPGCCSPAPSTASMFRSTMARSGNRCVSICRIRRFRIWLWRGNDLVIATHGRSFYILDDIGSLRQMTAAVASEDAHLFSPRTAVRGVYPANIDYYLAKQSDKVVIDILDSKSAVIRTFTGIPDDDKPKKGDAASPDEDPEFGPPRTKPPARKAGTNRYSWDGRYPGAHVFEGLIMWGARAEAGPLAPPGDYQVRLTANGVTQTRPLRLEKDPRETEVTQAQLDEQFQLAIKIRDEVSQADDTVSKIRELKKQAKDRSDTAKDATITAASASLRDTLSTIEEDLYQVRNRSNQDPLNFPIKLNNQIAALERVVESGDDRPTDQAYVVFQELSARLAAELSKYDEAVRRDLPKLNDLLTAHQLEPVKP